jgi:hypothetical protein
VRTILWGSDCCLTLLWVIFQLYSENNFMRGWLLFNAVVSDISVIMRNYITEISLTIALNNNCSLTQLSSLYNWNITHNSVKQQSWYFSYIVSTILWGSECCLTRLWVIFQLYSELFSLYNWNITHNSVKQQLLPHKIVLIIT